ncbi:uncharacterized protein LOC108113482 [Drosophila eugracilis]|uniref:uncharacterized protein LOC108113482 n=1 Tax=Drosophila eugracilis TaxID=29029 RepID=UPI0007E81458|nr:uncharacterized protein LOC108113482 [Drosophila eugracilis]
MLAKNTLSRAPTAISSVLALSTSQMRRLNTLYDPYDDGAPKALKQRMNLKKNDPLDKSKVRLKDLCWASMRRSEFKCRSDPEFKVPSFIDGDNRCLGPCATAYPRTDLMFYKPSDKLNRKYQRTWCECELTQRKRKAICRCRPPNFLRRPRPVLKSSSCSVGGEDLGLGLCRPEKKVSSCPRFKLPFCKPASVVGCRAGRPHAGCARRRTKYPSYSECTLEPTPDVPPTHCFCVNQPPMCVVWNYYRMKKS